MAKQTKKNTKSAALGESRGAADRSSDPLYVPLPDALNEAIGTLESGGDEYSAILESICGTTDDSQPVEQYDGTLGVSQAFVNAHQAAVCQFQWNDDLASIYSNPGTVSGARWGTGTMIADDIILTCGHLFDQTGGGWERPRVNGTTNIISPQEIATHMKANFNFQIDPSGVLRPEQSFAIVELIEYRLGSIDMAICRVTGNPGAVFGTETVSGADASDGQMICVIGHPAGQPKRIEAGPVSGISGSQIQYNDIDTLGGNSGSGIFRETDGRIVGVHTNGGCNSAGFNFGQRIEAVINVSPTLQGLLAPSIKFTDDGGGAKLKILDDNNPPTFKFRDDNQPTLKFRDDIPPTFKFRDDNQPTLKFRDDGNPPTRKFSDDGGGGSLKFIDDGPSTKALDDAKSPALDKNPSVDGKPPAADGGFSRQPIQNAGPRPFVMSTPHHSSAWQQAGQGSNAPRSQGEFAELQSEIEKVEASLAEAQGQMEELDAYYQELIAMYEAAHSGQ
ncbi:MAG: serine protease [Paracoccaceae bacterium]